MSNQLVSGRALFSLDKHFVLPMQAMVFRKNKKAS